MTNKLIRPRRLNHVRAAIYGQPWAISEDWLNAICEIFENNVAGVATDWVKASNGADGSLAAPFQVINGVAILPLRGPIFPRANMMTQYSGATSLEEYSDLFDLASELEDIKTILLDIDSPGGSVSGLQEFCDKVFNARQLSTTGEGPTILGCISGCGASAAYMIGSQANELYASPGSLVGSIGTVARRDNYNRAELNEGNDPVVLRSHELKAVGAGPFTDNQVNDMKRILAEYFQGFKDAVTRARPQIDIEKVATGQVWLSKSATAGEDAMSLGLIDGVSTLGQLLN